MQRGPTSTTTIVRAALLAGLSACATAPPLLADGRALVPVEIVTSGPTAMHRGVVRLDLDRAPWTTVEGAPTSESDETRDLPLDDGAHEIGVTVAVPCAASFDRCRYDVSASTRVRRIAPSASLKLEVVFGDGQLPPEKRVELRAGGDGVDILGGTLPTVQRPSFDGADLCTLYCAAAPLAATTGPNRFDAVCRMAVDLDAQTRSFAAAEPRDADGVDPRARQDWLREATRATAEVVTVCKGPPGPDRDEAVRRAFTRLQLLLDTVL